MPHQWELMTIYVLGQIVAMLVRGAASIKSNATPWDNVRSYLKWKWPPLLFRFFFATMLFLWWWDNPDLLNWLFKRFGYDAQHIIPLNLGTAGIYGLLSDTLLDWLTLVIPPLRRGVPSDAANGKSDNLDGGGK